MATKTIQVDPAGGPISVVLSSGHANPGHYGLLLIEKNRIDIVKEFPTTKFGSTAENTHQLPTGTSAHDGRFLNAVASVGLLDPAKAFAVFMKVSQDGNDLGEVSESGTGTDVTKVCELTAVLSATATGRAPTAADAPSAGRRRGAAPRKVPTLASRQKVLDDSTKALLRRGKKRRSANKAAKVKKATPKRKATAKKKTPRRRDTRRRGGAR